MAKTLLRPLFTLSVIEYINKALGSGATFTAPLMLLVALITFQLTKVTFTLHTLQSCHASVLPNVFLKHVEKK